jgi:hypothetical protein
MNPLDLVPKFVWVALVAVLAATSCKFKLDNTGLTLEIQKHATRIAELKEGISSANATAAEQGIAMERAKSEALAAAKVRERTLAAERDHARTQLAGLRVAVSQTERGFGLSTKPNPLGSSLEYADPFPELFLQCSERYLGVAEKADGHASDALMLLEAWPKVKE